MGGCFLPQFFLTMLQMRVYGSRPACLNWPPATRPLSFWQRLERSFPKDADLQSLDPPTIARATAPGSVQGSLRPGASCGRTSPADVSVPIHRRGTAVMSRARLWANAAVSRGSSIEVKKT
jgi:hypothetical protein